MRVGGTVRRPGGPAAAQVRLFLAHLEQGGFDGAPRFHGFDDRNREILDYLERSTLSSLPRLGNLYVLGRASNLGGLRGEKLTHVAAERRDRCASLSGLDGQ
jgi:hypothetical protein